MSPSLMNGNTLGLRRRRYSLGVGLELVSNLLGALFVNAHAAVQEAALLDGAAGLALMALGGLEREAVVGAVGARVGAAGRKVRDGVWAGVFDADASNAGVRGLARLAHGVVAAVKVLAFLALEKGKKDKV